VRAADEATLPSDVMRVFADLRDRTGDGSRAQMLVRSWGSCSATGTRRRENEDAVGHRAEHSFAVADGMGGRPGGAAAAATAVAALLDGLSAAAAPINWPRMVASTNEAVRVRAVNDGIERAAIHCSRNGVTVLHLGDVRVYRLRRHTPEQLTVDHNVAEQLARDDIDPTRLGLRTGELAALTGYLGDEDSAIDFAVRALATADGDRLVVCTDGVHRHLDGHVWRVVAELDDAAAATLLVDAAQRAGSTDDATALVLTLEVSSETRPTPVLRDGSAT
jgi:PPM family protein phosphatase